MKSSAAYDLSRFAPTPEREQPRVRVIENKKSQKAREMRAFSRKFTFICISLLILMSLTVYNRMLLTETKANIANKTQELVELQSENTYLNYQLETIISLKTAEEYATNNLGLVKIDAAQIEYLNLFDENVIEAGEEKMTGNIKDIFKYMIELICG